MLWHIERWHLVRLNRNPTRTARTHQEHLVGERWYAAVDPYNGVGLPQGVGHVLAAGDAYLAAGGFHSVVATAPNRLAVLLKAQLTDTCHMEELMQMK